MEGSWLDGYHNEGPENWMSDSGNKAKPSMESRCDSSEPYKAIACEVSRPTSSPECHQNAKSQ